MTKNLSQRLEDYLEAAYIFEKENGFSRIKEISSFLNVKLPSVNKAINKLKKRNLLNHQKYGYIKLTGKGKKFANEILSTHNLLIEFFTILGLDDKKSLKYSCYMEHIIDKIDKTKIKKLINFLKEKKYGINPLKSTRRKV